MGPVTGKWTARQRIGQDGRPVSFVERETAPGVFERRYDQTLELRQAATAYPISLGASDGVSPSPAGACRVVLSAEARRAILRAAEYDNSTEKGGALLGRIADDGTVIVAHAFDGSKNRKAHSVSLDFAKRGGQLTDERVVGDWHLHPSGDRLPSEADRDGWDAGFRHARADGAGCWIGVIVTTTKRFATPVIHAYAVDMNGARKIDL